VRKPCATQARGEGWPFGGSTSQPQSTPPLGGRGLRHACIEGDASLDLHMGKKSAPTLENRRQKPCSTQWTPVVVPGRLRHRGVTAKIPGDPLARSSKVSVPGALLDAVRRDRLGPPQRAWPQWRPAARADADSPDPSYPPAAEQQDVVDLGNPPCAWASTPVRLPHAAWPALYGEEVVIERHRHRYRFKITPTASLLPRLGLIGSAQLAGWPLWSN